MNGDAATEAVAAGVVVEGGIAGVGDDGFDVVVSAEVVAGAGRDGAVVAESIVGEEMMTRHW